MKYIKVNLKPLSVNKAWKGKRIKTTDYSKFEKSCLLILPIYEIPKCDLELFIHYGFSSKGSDIDNPNKMVIDILSKKYGFNDNLIYLNTFLKLILLLYHTLKMIHFHRKC